MLKVGAGIACINPTPDLFPWPKPPESDWGLAPETIEGIYDDMNCRAIAIDNGKDKFMFIAFELSGVPVIPELPGQIAQATGFPEDNILLFGTHNHTGVKDNPKAMRYQPTEEEIAAMAKYTEIERSGAIAAAKMAADSLRPAKYGFGTIDSYINTNRDLQTLGGYWVEGRNLAGYSDKTLAIVKFVDEEGKLIAALLNHPTHATCCYLMRDADHKRKTSGNFTGIACRFVEEHYGNGAVCMWSSGAAGNQNPLLSHGLQYEYSDGWTSAVDYPDGVGHMQMELMGRTHGADAVKGLDSIKQYKQKMSIKHLRKSAYLPAQKKADPNAPTTAFRMGGRGTDRSDVPYGQIPPVPEGPKMADNGLAEMKMHLIILGDIAILCANAELYCQIGRDMKLASPYKNTFVMTHTDMTKTGYILDESSKDYKVFQAFSAIKPGSSDKIIVRCELDLFEEALD